MERLLITPEREEELQRRAIRIAAAIYRNRNRYYASIYIEFMKLAIAMENGLMKLPVADMFVATGLLLEKPTLNRRVMDLSYAEVHLLIFYVVRDLAARTKEGDKTDSSL